MKLSVQINRAGAVATLVAAALLLAGCGHDGNDGAAAPAESNSSSNAPAETSVKLSGDQLKSIQIAPVDTYAFPVEKTGIGSIDFENNLYSDASLSTQVSPPVAGSVNKIFVELGDEVQKGAPLYSIETSGTNLIVRNPLAGQVTAVNATAGLWVEPSNPPAPCSVADVSKKWLLASVPEADSAAYHVGEKVQVSVTAFPGQVFKGRVTKIYPTVDLTTHRLTIRAEISDDKNQLLTGMLANFIVDVHNPIKSIALPVNGVVREGDGTMTAWVTTDRQHFTQRVVKVGLSENGEDQILEGLQRGELAVTDGAIFLDNMLQAPPSD